MGTKSTFYDGQVTFECGFQSLESYIVSEAIDTAIPEHRQYEIGSQLYNIFSNFRFYLSNTEGLSFKLSKDADADLLNLQAFWKVAADSTDYAKLWPLFRKRVSLDVSDTWEAAITASIPKRLLAPPDLRPTAPDDEVLDPNALTPVTSP